MHSETPIQYGAQLAKDWEACYDALPLVVNCELPALQGNWHLSHCPSMKLLDIGCGSGDTTRPLKALTGGTVVGVDISPDMLKAAQEYEDKHKQGIQYFVADCTKDLMQIPGIAAVAPFDMVSASWTLAEVGKLEELRGMMASVYGVLKKGGRFCGLLNSVFLRRSEFQIHERYGLTTVIEGEGEVLQDGQRFNQTMVSNPKVKPLKIYNFYWTPETCKKIAKEVGFNDIYFLPPPYPYYAENEYEAAFYKPHTEKPDYSLFTCTK